MVDLVDVGQRKLVSRASVTVGRVLFQDPPFTAPAVAVAPAQEDVFTAADLVDKAGVIGIPRVAACRDDPVYDVGVEAVGMVRGVLVAVRPA
jgi:hypothetical protein